MDLASFVQLAKCVAGAPLELEVLAEQYEGSAALKYSGYANCSLQLDVTAGL